MKIDRYSISQKALNSLREVERFQGLWEHASLRQSPQFVKSLKRTTIVTSSGSSTRIEGALISDDEVKKLVQENCKISSMSSRSDREVVGYVDALQYIYDNYKELEVSELNIRSLHQKMTAKLLPKHLPDNQRGAYKDVPNNIVEQYEETGEEKVWYYTTPPGPQTDVEMESLISNFIKIDHQNIVSKPILIASFVVHFLAIHPFRDGNGRLSRLITIWLLLRSGYDWAQYSSHEKVIEDNKEGYYISLRNTQKTFKGEKFDYNYWVEFFLSVLEKQAFFLKNKISHNSPKATLSKNENTIYQLIKEYEVCNPSFLLDHVEMTENGLKTLLRRLVDRGLIKAIGKTKGRKYEIIK